MGEVLPFFAILYKADHCSRNKKQCGMREALKLSVALGFFFYMYKIIYLKRSSPIKMLAWAWPNLNMATAAAQCKDAKHTFLFEALVG